MYEDCSSSLDQSNVAIDPRSHDILKAPGLSKNDFEREAMKALGAHVEYSTDNIYGRIKKDKEKKTHKYQGGLSIPLKEHKAP